MFTFKQVILKDFWNIFSSFMSRVCLKYKQLTLFWKTINISETVLLIVVLYYYNLLESNNMRNVKNKLLNSSENKIHFEY